MPQTPTSSGACVDIATASTDRSLMSSLHRDESDKSDCGRSTSDSISCIESTSNSDSDSDPDPDSDSVSTELESTGQNTPQASDGGRTPSYILGRSEENTPWSEDENATGGQSGMSSEKTLGCTSERLSPKQKLIMTQAELAQCRVKIGELNSRIRDMDHYTSFMSKFTKSNHLMDRTALEHNMFELRLAMDHAFALEYDEMHELCENISPAVGSELSALFSRVFGEQIARIRQLEFLSLLQSLVSASICIWVFESSLEDECLTITPIFQEYLSQVRSLGEYSQFSSGIEGY